MAQLNLEWTEVRAPIAGRIGRKLISEGNLVNANTTLLTTIVSLDPIYFYFDIDERSFLAYQRVFKNRGGPAGEGNDVLVGVSDEPRADPQGAARLSRQPHRCGERHASAGAPSCPIPTIS